MQKGTDIFDKIIKNETILGNQQSLVENLMKMLKSKERFLPDEELAFRVGEHACDLSSINCSIPSWNYGTRTHTVILVDKQNKMDYYEETMATQDPNGEWTNTHIEKQF